MSRFRAIIEYDGTDFLGFQRQAQGRTVQGELESALRRLGWSDSSLLGAGRTDTGVHATGQVISFDLAWRHPESALLRALNANLPVDVAAKKVETCATEFHPRYAARTRHYRYTLYVASVRSPRIARYAWQVWPSLNLSDLQAASQCLLGTHNFATFGTDPDGGTNTIRTVTVAEWQAVNEFLYFDIQAEAFLYHMVRSLVGALKRVGAGEMSVSEFEQLLRSADRSQCPPLAPPHGLCLTQVMY